MRRKFEFNQALINLKNDYAKLRILVSSFQNVKNELENIFAENSGKEKIYEYRNFLDFKEGLDYFPLPSERKKMDLEKFFRDLTDEEFYKENDLNVKNIPFWEKAEVWVNNDNFITKKEDLINKYEEIYELSKIVNDNLLLGSYKDLMIEAIDYNSPEIEEFQENKDKLIDQEKFFESQMNNSEKLKQKWKILIILKKN